MHVTPKNQNTPCGRIVPQGDFCLSASVHKSGKDGRRVIVAVLSAIEFGMELHAKEEAMSFLVNHLYIAVGADSIHCQNRGRCLDSLMVEGIHHHLALSA